LTSRVLTLTICVGMFLIVLGLMDIFLFSTQILVPAQLATPGYWETRTSPTGSGPQRVWHPGQPEHFEMSFPNLPTGLSFILAGLAVSAGGVVLPEAGSCTKLAG
jgi:hypothetical protein